MKPKNPWIICACIATLVAGLGFVEYRLASQLREENRALREQLKELTEVQRPHTEPLEQASATLSPEERLELLRLRAEVTRLRAEAGERGERARAEAQSRTTAREAPAVFHWSNRPELTPDQSRLVTLQKKLARMSETDDRRAGTQEEIDRLRQQTGGDLRAALPDELQLSQADNSEVSEVFNPTQETLVFHIGVKNDTQWVGSAVMSMMREVFLPPGGRLLVPDLQSTSPRFTGTDR